MQAYQGMAQYSYAWNGEIMVMLLCTFPTPPRRLLLPVLRKCTYRIAEKFGGDFNLAVSFFEFPNTVLSLHPKFHSLKFSVTSPPLLIMYPQQWHCEWLGSIMWQVGVVNCEPILIHTDGLSFWWRLWLCGTFMRRDTVCNIRSYFVVQNKWSQALIHLSMEILLRNFLYSLEHCIAPRD